MNDTSDDLLFADEESSAETQREPRRWRLLIVDDEEEVHTVTRLVLGDFNFEGRGLEFLSAYSGEESLALLRENPDVAVVLLDVVMEDNHAGLDAARRIREELGNSFVRIILRTGQPGQAPEGRVITSLDINDYKQKTELTAQKLATSVTTALRSYRDLRVIEENRLRLARLAMSVAHIIRNRTMTISGFAKLAARQMDEESPAHGHLETIRKETFRLEEVVSAVSEFAGIPRSSRRHFKALEILDKALREAEKTSAEGHFDVSIVADIEDTVIVGDPELFQRMAFELLDNAVRFSPRGGEVRLTLRPTSYGCLLNIADSGQGITEEDSAFVFDPFFSTRADAVGMGLCIVRRIVNEHHWDMDIRSEPGRGTEVDVFIPLPDEPHENCEESGENDLFTQGDDHE